MNNNKHTALACCTVLLLLMAQSCSSKTQQKELAADNNKDSVQVENSKNVEVDTIPEFARRVIDAYPAFGITFADGKLLFSDGTAIVYDDGREKSFTEKLDDCDVEDMFSMTYDVEADIPAYLDDCGRGRCEALFKKMYGRNEAEARSHLVSVKWFGQNIQFTEVNSAADQLKRVAAELAQKPELRKYLTGATTFYWRKVRGANRQSAHSYGIAIDINTSYSNYWLWSNPGKSETAKLKYENRIPIDIVKVFEKYGFIWGGRWYHYDTMHFEYRPELTSGKE